MVESHDLPESDDEFARALENEHLRLMSAGPRVHQSNDLKPEDSSSRLNDALQILSILEEVRTERNNRTPNARDFAQDTSTLRDFSQHSPHEIHAGTIAFPESTSISNIKRLGRFTIIQQIGSGGYGIVVRARDEKLGRDVALKIPRFETAFSLDSRVRFQREAKAAAALNHPAIVSVHQVGSEHGIDYIVSELVEGESLATFLARGGKISHGQAAHLVARLADAVHHAHQRGVLHRDIKPSNILLARSTDKESNKLETRSILPGKGKIPQKNGDIELLPLLTDFGLATLADENDFTQSGAVVGTPAYLSPEQASGQRNSFQPATDVYGLGAVLYELLTGRAPFAGLPLLETLRAVTDIDPKAPTYFDSTIPKDIESIC